MRTSGGTRIPVLYCMFRRGHTVLKESLPSKTEHVLFVRMTAVQRRLYKRFMEELITNRSEEITKLHYRLTATNLTVFYNYFPSAITEICRCVSNPLKAFAVCCKIWNHPDVLYNFLRKKEGIDIDVDPEEVLTCGEAGRPGRSEGEILMQFGKKEEINYDWAQVKKTLNSIEILRNQIHSINK